MVFNVVPNLFLRFTVFTIFNVDTEVSLVSTRLTGDEADWNIERFELDLLRVNAWLQVTQKGKEV
jgi:hypothetical protein